MKHLFVINAGDYEYDTLNNYNRGQMRNLGRLIKNILKGQSAYVISSTAPWVRDSAIILIEELGLPFFEKLPYLWASDNGPKKNYFFGQKDDKLLEIVNERRGRADGLLMVSHNALTSRFPRFFYKKEFGRSEPIDEIGDMEAVHFDIEGKTYRIIPERGYRFNHRCF
jgi:hypothetical protein